MSQWTPEAIETLSELRAKGWSPGDIAASLGVTRNAVIGKSARLGLTKKRPIGSRHRTLAHLGLQRPRPRPKPLSMTTKPMPVLIPHLALDTPRPPATDSPSGSGAAHIALHHWQCKWPSGDPRTDFRFGCGERHLEGQPYCAEHSARAFRPR